MEMADKNASELKLEETKSGVNELKKPLLEGNRKPNITHLTGKRNCYHCGGLQSPTSCRFKTEKCRKCGKVGHTKRNYHTKNALQGEVEEQETFVTRFSKTRNNPTFLHHDVLLT